MNESLYGERLTFTELDTLLKSTAETIFDGDDELQEFGGTTPTNTDYKRLDVEAMALEIVKPSIDLYFESDWGFDETDDVTGDTAPTFTGSAPAGWHAWLYVDNVQNASAPVDGFGNYTLTATAQGTGLKNFTVKVGANSSIADVYRSTSSALPITIVASETLISATTFKVRMNEDLVVSGVNSVDSQLQAAWPTATTRWLTKTGVGTVTIPDPNNAISISDRTVPATYNADGGKTFFNINTGIPDSASATQWTLNADGRVEFTTTQNLAALYIEDGGFVQITKAAPPNYKLLYVYSLGFAEHANGNAIGTLDLTNNGLAIDFATLEEARAFESEHLRGWLLDGRGGPGIGYGRWDGTGITSSTAAAWNVTNPEERSIGYAVNGDLPLGACTIFFWPIGGRLDDYRSLYGHGRREPGWHG